MQALGGWGICGNFNLDIYPILQSHSDIILKIFWGGGVKILHRIVIEKKQKNDK